MSEAVRRVFFFSCAAFILLAPSYKQFVAAAPAYAVRWDMFGRKGQDLYEVRFESQDESGKRVGVDRFAVLGFSDPLQAPRHIRTFKQEQDAWTVARSLCRALGPDKPLFMFLRDATARGWAVVEDGTHDVCKGRPQLTAPARTSGGHDDEDAVP